MNKLLPPFLFLIAAASMLVANRLLPLARLDSFFLATLGILIAAAGAALLVWARVQFLRARTNIYTFEEPGTLVTDGAFRLSRHPMYLGFALVLIGLAVHLGSAVAFLPAAAFVLVADRWYIAFEERRLFGKFGDAYATYARRTRRWL